MHDWFVNYMGAEKCVESFTNIFPEADIFSLIDFLDDDLRKIILKGKKANTSFVQKLPFAKSKYRQYFPFMPLAVEQLDISQHDVILSSSHAFAKGVLTNTNQMHICYCHTPIRYAWDLYHQYMKEAGLTKGLKGMVAQRLLHKIRMWDFTTANRVDHFLANSNHIKNRIRKVYNRDSDVIYPPVNIIGYNETPKEDFYLAVARFVPYKKVDLIVEAFTKMPDKKLVVIGTGPDEKKIKAIATPNITFAGYQSDESLHGYMRTARAFMFAAEEDFGITIVEAQSAGTPVIAYGVGGATETVLNEQTGLLFKEQTPDSLVEAVKTFEKIENSFSPEAIAKHAEQFSKERFEKEIFNFVKEKTEEKFG